LGSSGPNVLSQLSADAEVAARTPVMRWAGRCCGKPRRLVVDHHDEVSRKRARVCWELAWGGVVAGDGQRAGPGLSG
jgi:hypothetical protein